MKPVAVIILNWNGAKLLRKYLPTVLAGTNTDIADVIVADNGSTDNSREVLEQEFAQVKTLYLDKNYGFAGGYNKAIELTRYQYTVLLNSDVRTPAGWLEPLYRYLEDNHTVGAVQPKLLHDRNDGKRMFEYAGAAGGFIDKHGYPYCRGRVFEAVEDDHGQYDGKDIDIFWATGACLMVRTELYNRVGGLDEDFFAHMEEIDLCWRIHLSGSDVRVVTASEVFHLGGGSLPQGNPRKTYLNFRNSLFLLYKNLPVKEGKRMLIVRRLYDTLAFFMALAKLHGGDAKAIIRAHNDYRKLKSRYTCQPTVNLLKSFPGTEHNIVIDYYLRGKKLF
ncbi:MAG: glycosyltransferase family 2 protein [Muribaculaceae bacterium]|nr:glycosyltransferase family 2 protein [Muribaculaceae bacterium]